MRNNPHPRPTSAANSCFDARSYWETRLQEYPGLCGVGNTCLGRSYIQWLYKVRRAVFLRLLASLKTDFRAARVFDVGAGTGFYLELWKQVGVSSVAGCDLTEIAVARLRSIGFGVWVCCYGPGCYFGVRVCVVGTVPGALSSGPWCSLWQ